MAICTFFGHRDCPTTIREQLKNVLVRLISGGVDEFYVGTNGAFDALVISVLKELKKAMLDMCVANEKVHIIFCYMHPLI